MNPQGRGHPGAPGSDLPANEVILGLRAHGRCGDERPALCGLSTIERIENPPYSIIRCADLAQNHALKIERAASKPFIALGCASRTLPRHCHS
jgi:hypothetical protein